MQKIYSYVLGFLTNSLNDIYLFKYMLQKSFHHFKIHSNLVFTVFFKYLKNKSFYKNQIINFKILEKNKTSSKLFIFGSGASIKEIDEKSWKKINEFDTLGFNGTYLLEKINFTYHILRAGDEAPSVLNENFINKEILYAKNVTQKIINNSYLKKTIFLFPSGICQHFPNLLLGYKFWNKNNLVYRYRVNRFAKYPKGNISRGLIHQIGTLSDAICFGFYMGYKEIILVGVDLYNNEYFYTNEGKTTKIDEVLGVEVNADFNHRGLKVNENHNTVNNGIINLIDEWGIYFKKNDIKLSVYNPKSLLNKVLPTFKI